MIKQPQILIVIALLFVFTITKLHSQCDANFTITGPQNCNQSITASVNNPQGNATYTWTMGDGTPLTGNPVSHTYNVLGAGVTNFNITLTVMIGMEECTNSQSVQVDQLPDPTIADLNIFSPFAYCDGNDNYILEVENASSTLATNTNYNINWGDGSTDFSGSSIPDGLTHEYSQEGFSFITLTVTGNNGCNNSSTFPFYMGENPSVGLGIPTLGNTCVPETILFPIQNTQANSLGTIYTLQASDGSDPIMFNHPPPANFEHLFTISSCDYTSLGGFQDAFHVSIVASNPCDESASTVEPIRTSSPPVADIEVNPPLSSCPDEVFEFCNDSQGGNYYVASTQSCIDALDLIWSITPNTYTLENGTNLDDECIDVSFSVPGMYIINLTSENPCDVSSTIDTIFVDEIPIAEAVSNFDPAQNCAPVEVEFTNNSINFTGSTWTISPLTGWEFTNGTDQNSTNPIILFTAADTYTVTLVAANSCTDDDWVQIIEIFALSSVTIASVDSQCDSITFQPTASNIFANGCPITNYEWSFPGSNLPTFTGETPPLVTYNSAGNYTFSLTTTNCCGSSLAEQIVNVDGSISNINIDPVPPLCENEDCIFLVGTPVGGTWASSDGFINSTTGEFCPSNFNIDTPTVTYSIGDPGAICQSVATTIIEIVSLPMVSTTISDTTVCDGAEIFTLTANPIGGTWSGDPSVSSEGIFDPSLATLNQNITLTYTFVDSTTLAFCSNTATTTITVEGLPTLALADTSFFCLTNEIIDLENELDIVEDLGTIGIWQGLGIVNSNDGLFDGTLIGSPDTTVQLVYTFNSVNNCIATDTIAVQITSPQEVVLPLDTAILCMTDLFFTPTYTPTLGMWSGGVEINTNTGEIDLELAGEGVHTYTYIIFPNTTCEDSDQFSIDVIDLAGVEAGNNIDVCESVDEITLSGFSPLEDGTWTGSGVSPEGVVNIAALDTGTYVLTYTIESQQVLCSSQDSITLHVHPLPIVDFTWDGLQCLGDSIFFSEDADIGDNFDWTFEIGATENGVDVFYQFPSAGDYPILLEVTTEHGCTDIHMDTIHISEPPPLVEFTVDTDQGCADLEVNFTNNSLGENLTYIWNYGFAPSNDTIFEPNTISFPTGLTDTVYVVQLMVENTCGDHSFVDSITVFPLPVSFFGTNLNSYCSGDTIDIEDASYGDPTSCIWDYGNGITSTDCVPVDQIYFTGDDPQTITLTLITENNCGSDTLSTDITINPTNVNAFFNTDPLEICKNDSIAFTSLATVGATLVWDFGDGSTSTLTNPVHTYTSAGPYDVVQYVYGCGLDSLTVPINVLANPTAAFAFPPSACLGEEVFFENLSSASVDNSNWQIGDSLINNTNVNFVFDEIGIYNISLNVNTQDACQNSTTGQIQINPLPLVSFTSPDSICVGETITFTNTTLGSIGSCSWDFGDGESGTNCTETHSYNTIGNFVAILTVFDGNDCFDILSKTIYVRPTPIVDFTIDTFDICSPTEVFFNNMTTNANDYNWTFENGETSSNADTSILFETGGSFLIQLEANYDGICFNTKDTTIQITQTPEADFILSDTTGCADFDLSLSNNSIGTVTSFNWNFDGGIGSLEENPSVVYTNTGIYTIILSVENNACPDTASTDIEVFIPVDAEYTITDLTCNNINTGSINVNVSQGTTPYNYQWSNGELTPMIDELPAGNYTLTITDNNACTWIETILINQPSPLSIEIQEEQIVTCFGGSDGTLAVQGNGGTPGYSYIWNNNVSNSNLENISAGDYTITLTDSNNCKWVELFSLGQNSAIELDTVVKDISCFGENDGSIVINNVLGGVNPFEVYTTGPSFDEEGTAYTNLTPGVYEILVQDAEDCQQTFDIEIFEPFAVDLDIVQDSIGLLLGDSIQFITNYNANNPSFLWTPSAYLSCDTCPEPFARPFINQLYHLRLWDENGCTDFDTVKVFINSPRKVFIPDAFTPNFDGENDIFTIRTGDPAFEEVIAFRVYDRWGELLFEQESFPANDPRYGWDGTYRGRNLDPSVFVYYVEVKFIDGLQLIYKGDITLIR